MGAGASASLEGQLGDNNGALSVSDITALLRQHGYSEPGKRAKGLVIALGLEDQVSRATLVAAIEELGALVAPLKAGGGKMAVPPAKVAAPPKKAGALAIASASDGESTEAAILAELNLARTNPKEYAQLLEPRLAQLQGNTFRPPNTTMPLVTDEGAAAVREAILFLGKQTPLAAFVRQSPGMSQAALDHVMDTGPKGLCGHDGSDGSSPVDRLTRHGSWQSSAAENIAYGTSSAREIVLQLIVDDGVPSRGHRLNIFSPTSTVVGIATGAHKKFATMACITFAGGFVEGTPGGVAAPAGSKAPPAKSPLSKAPPANAPLPVSAPQAAPVAAASNKSKPGASSLGAVRASDGSQVFVPPGGKKAVQTEVAISGNQKKTTTTTIITDALGNQKKFVATKVETC